MTETALLVDPLADASVLADLARSRRISIDDFGCGQTSLGYLSTLPIHELHRQELRHRHDRQSGPRRDRPVDRGSGPQPGAAGRRRGRRDRGRSAGLRAAGCDVAQGYLFAGHAAVRNCSNGWPATSTGEPRATHSRSDPPRRLHRLTRRAEAPSVRPAGGRPSWNHPDGCRRPDPTATAVSTLRPARRGPRRWTPPERRGSRLPRGRPGWRRWRASGGAGGRQASPMSADIGHTAAEGMVAPTAVPASSP